MKKILLVLLGFMLFNPFVESAWAGTNVKKSGRLEYHNYVALNYWAFDSLKVGADDTVRFMHDSATTRPFTTATLGKIKTTVDGTYDKIPDSTQLMITRAGEGDATSIQVVYYVGMLGTSGPFFLVGTPDTLTMTGSTRDSAVTHITVARKLYPNAHHYWQVKGTTATDTARIYRVQAIPVFR